MEKRIGIFGGSFNPIHIGHLIIAEAACQKFNLEKVIFIPSGDTPNKSMHNINKFVRYEMVKIAIEDNYKFDISPIEINRNGPSYTVNTIHELKDIMKEKYRIFFIAGSDAIADLPNWKHNMELLTLCDFICVERSGDEKLLFKSIMSFDELGKTKIHRLRIPKVDISSTILRNMIKDNRSVKYFIPDKVIEIIHKFNLYK